MRFGLVGGSYTAISSNIADEETINWYQETRESQGAIAPEKAYGGSTANSLPSLIRTPGLSVFASLPGVPRASREVNGRLFVVAGAELCEISSSGAVTNRGAIVNDGKAASIAYTNIQILIVSAGFCYCYTLATNTLVDVTALLSGVPVKCDQADTYFVVQLQGNKFQLSQLNDGTTWPAPLLQEVSVFPDDIRSIIVNHREIWVFGKRHCQPYQDTGSAEAFDIIQGALLEKGCVATFAPCLLDNSVFWIDEDDRGARMAWRSSNYTPQRVSTHAVEVDLQAVSDLSGMTSYSYQDGGHIFWVLYVPGIWSWTYDVEEQTWHKRASWTGFKYAPHWSWNYVYAFGKHLVGDWNSSNLYVLSLNNLDDNGTEIRRLRRTPTLKSEIDRIQINQLRLDIDTGIGPQPPLVDATGQPRGPQVMMRWSRNGGRTWSNEHWKSVGQAGEYGTLVRWWRLGMARRWVFEFVVTDPVAWTINDGHINPQDDTQVAA